jgi:HEAT repeats
MRGRAAAGLVVMAAVLHGAAAAQALARRVADAGDGSVRFTYATRPDVEICDQGIRMGDNRMQWRSHGWDDEPTNCRYGSADVELGIRDGQVRSVELIQRRSQLTAAATDLGEVDPGDAARYLIGVARTAGSRRVADEALMPAVLADADDLWRDLMAVAKDRGVDAGVRKSALFWVGQEAADVVTTGLADVARDEDENQGVRDAAVFALSQRPAEEGVPVLMDLARTAHEAKTRKSALFWLAQCDDPRVIPFFEEILLGKRGG